MNTLGLLISIAGMSCGLICMKTTRFIGFVLTVLNLIVFTVMLTLMVK